MAWNIHDPSILVVRHTETEVLEDSLHNGFVNGCPKKLLDPVLPQRGSNRFSRSWINVDHIAIDGAAGNCPDHRRRAIARVARHLNVGSSLKTIRGLTRDA